jgi:rare lipoprotein A
LRRCVFADFLSTRRPGRLTLQETTMRIRHSWLLATILALAGGIAAAGDRAAPAAPDSAGAKKGPATGAAPHAQLPKRQVGKASFYADRFAGRKMANGKPMDPNQDNAASRTLPLGTKARVTNLETGRSAVVTIEDRGPYVDGRIVDLSPATAQKIGLEKKQGLAPVEVVPLEVPSQTVAAEDVDR